MKLSITPKNKDVEEQLMLIYAVGTSCHRAQKPPRDINKKPVISAEPPRSYLCKMDTTITGWLEGKGTHKKFNDQIEKYENNQYYWNKKYKKGKISKEELIQNLTDLEKWFVCIIEPPPKRLKKIPIESYMKELEPWRNREHIKYKHTRSYYCDDDVIPLLDKESLLSVQKQIFENFEKVKVYFDKYVREYDKILELREKKLERLRQRVLDQQEQEKEKRSRFISKKLDK